MLSYDELYRQHNAALLRYARNVSQASEEAPDIVHSAWIAFIASGAQPSNPRTWLMLIVKREWWRFAKRQVGVAYTDEYDMLDSPCEGGQENAEERRRIALAVDGLSVPAGRTSGEIKPASDAMKENLRFMFAGYDSGEIARVRGVSGASVRDNLSRGIKALKTHWGIDK